MKKSIELLRQLFVDAHNEGCLRDVWNIVTALRGPDSGSDALKYSTTTEIRTMLLNRNLVFELGLSDYGSFIETLSPNPETDLNTKRIFDGLMHDDANNTHFKQHMMLAICAMKGMSYYEVQNALNTHILNRHQEKLAPNT